MDGGLLTWMQWDVNEPCVADVQMKTEIDSFSNRRVYPSRGRLYVRGDSKVRSPVMRRAFAARAQFHAI